jgi:predicted RNase H-like HicB family nuclease
MHHPHSVKLGVTPCLRLECKFWLEDDGWHATVESLGLVVHSPTFETAKSDMEATLGKHIEALLSEGRTAHGHAA